MLMLQIPAARSDISIRMQSFSSPAPFALRPSSCPPSFDRPIWVSDGAFRAGRGITTKTSNMGQSPSGPMVAFTASTSNCRQCFSVVFFPSRARSSFETLPSRAHGTFQPCQSLPDSLLQLRAKSRHRSLSSLSSYSSWNWSLGPQWDGLAERRKRGSTAFLLRPTLLLRFGIGGRNPRRSLWPCRPCESSACLVGTLCQPVRCG